MKVNLRLLNEKYRIVRTDQRFCNDRKCLANTIPNVDNVPQMTKGFCLYLKRITASISETSNMKVRE